MLNLDTQPREAVRPSVLGGDLVLTEHAVSVLRAHLRSAGLDEWRIFRGPVSYLATIDDVLDRLDPEAVWETPGRSLVGEEPLIALSFEDEPRARVKVRQGGVLHLRRAQVLVARWYWFDTFHKRNASIYLLAAPRADCIEALRQRLIALNARPPEPVWQIVGQYGAEASVPREPLDDDALVLSADLRGRVETEIIGFFTPAVAAMYRRLNVPYRRGVLMYGLPGNGKTSLIRWIGGRLPDVAAILLRAGSGFDTDTLTETFNDWKRLAPAILVIEDLTAVLASVNLSTLLNLLDGVDRKIGGGLMMIASTNDPDKLDSALSNRPGRFDVVFEMPSPDEPQRRAFLRGRLLELDTAAIDAAVEGSARLSFAHLEEIVHLSGLIAIGAGREHRVADDLAAAVGHVRRAFNAARTGYAKAPEVPFGLAPRRA